MENLRDAVHRVLENEAPKLANATTIEAVEELSTQIANEIVSRYRAPGKDPFAYRAVIAVLGFVVIIVTIIYSVIAINGGDANKIPDVLISLGSASVGALAGLLSPNLGHAD